jgi:hypothetical protein
MNQSVFISSGKELRFLRHLLTRQGHKNDFRDAHAVAEAVQRPTTRFVLVKTDEQLDLQALHRVRVRIPPRNASHMKVAQKPCGNAKVRREEPGRIAGRGLSTGEPPMLAFLRGSTCPPRGPHFPQRERMARSFC